MHDRCILVNRDTARELTRADGGGRVWVIDMKEKGSDVNLATELICDGFSGNYDVAAVVSNDSDLVAPIRAVIDKLNISVGVINPHIRKTSRPSVEMKKCCTFYRTVHKKTLRDCQMPDTLVSHRGFGEERIRMISARRATRKERHDFAERTRGRRSFLACPRLLSVAPPGLRTVARFEVGLEMISLSF